MEAQVETFRRRYLLLSLVNIVVLLVYGIVVACVLSQAAEPRAPYIDLEILNITGSSGAT